MNISELKDVTLKKPWKFKGHMLTVKQVKQDRKV